MKNPRKTPTNEQKAWMKEAGYTEVQWEPCRVCSSEYSQKIVAVVERYHGCVTEAIKTVKVSYCPVCGRPLTEEAWAELEKRLRG